MHTVLVAMGSLTVICGLKREISNKDRRCLLALEDGTLGELTCKQRDAVNDRKV